jgi:ketosteroid isomerase-like protein
LDLQTKTLVDYVTAFNAHDARAVAKTYTSDAVFAELGDQGGDSKGEAAILADYTEIFEGFPDAKIAITRSWHMGDTVLVEYVEGGTAKGGGEADEAEQRSYGYVGARLLWFDAAGLVKREQTYSDELTTEVRLGWAQQGLEKLEIRPLVQVPAFTGTWEQHRANGSTEENQLVAIRQKLYTKLTTSAEQDYLDLLTEDVVLAAYDEPRDANGKQEISAVFRQWKTMFSEIKMDATHTWACDDFAIFEGVFSGTHSGPWGPLQATNKHFASHFLDVARITKDGKIDRIWTYANNGELLTHLGLRTPRR